MCWPVTSSRIKITPTNHSWFTLHCIFGTNCAPPFASLSFQISQLIIITPSCSWCHTETKMLCYRKDDRAMRPIHGWPEIFRDSLTTPTATRPIPNIYQGLLFRSTLLMLLQHLKFVALPVPEIIGVPKKFGQPLDTLTLHFFQIFNGLLFGLAL